MVKQADYLAAQVSVLGSVLIDPSVTGTVMARTKPEDYTGQYRSIYLAASELFSAGEEPDPVKLRNKLGADYTELMLSMMEVTPTAANVEAYLDLMLEQSKLERLRLIAFELSSAPTMDTAQELMSKANAFMVARSAVQYTTMEAGLLDFMARQDGTPPEYLSFGMKKLDGQLYAERGDMIVLGGYASDGKTALALQMAAHQAKTKRVGFFSFETNSKKLVDRIVATQTQMDFRKIKQNKLDDNDWESIAQKTNTVSKLPLELVHASSMTVQDVRAFALSRRYDVIYLDYLQIIAPDSGIRNRSDFEKVSCISQALHQLSQTTQITVVALSQLSRPEKTGKEQLAPGMHALRSSGQIEQDADVIMLLYKDEPDKPNSLRTLKIAKNKEGETGQISLVFRGNTQTFIETDKPTSVQSDLNATGRTIKQMQRAKCAQISLEEITGTDPALPFS